MKTANIAQITNVAAVVNEPTNNGKIVIQYIKEANRFMKENEMHAEKCVAKEKYVGNKKSVGKFVDKKGKFVNVFG